MDAASIEHRLTEALSQMPPRVVAAYLFGSFARGTPRPGKDVDVAILLAEDPPRTLEGLELDLAGDLERAVGRTVDLIVLNRAPAELAHYVLRDGRLLLERDRARRVRFEVAARHEYFDLLPILERYRGIAARR